MNAATPSLAPATGRHPTGGNAITMRWAALTEASRVVAMLAGVTVARPAREIRDFPALMRDGDPWRREATERGLEDLAAIMEPGLAALMAINARGADCQAAAQALWAEFAEARNALVSLLPPSGAMGPRRCA